MDQDFSNRNVAGLPNETVFQSTRAPHDAALNCDPQSAFWKETRVVELQFDTHRLRYHQHCTQARSRWTSTNLYVLFSCPYEELYLNPHPVTDRKTFELWNWDVAELFIGCDFQNINHYKEFEVSPRGEWIDLDIDLDLPDHTVGWKWDSGFEAAARIDRPQSRWYGAMRIPFEAIDSQPAVAGRIFRTNLCRSQGPPQRRQLMAWRAPMKDTFHSPESFGCLELVDPAQESVEALERQL